jgi:hypothetical protein
MNDWTNRTKSYFFTSQSVRQSGSRDILRCQVVKRWESGKINRLEMVICWLFITFIRSKCDLLSDIRRLIFLLLRHSHDGKVSDLTSGDDYIQRQVHVYFSKRTIRYAQFESGYDLSWVNYFVFFLAVWFQGIRFTILSSWSSKDAQKSVQWRTYSSAWDTAFPLFTWQTKFPFALFATAKGIFPVNISCQTLFQRLKRYRHEQSTFCRLRSPCTRTNTDWSSKK